MKEEHDEQSKETGQRNKKEAATSQPERPTDSLIKHCIKEDAYEEQICRLIIAIFLSTWNVMNISDRISHSVSHQQRMSCD